MGKRLPCLFKGTSTVRIKTYNISSEIEESYLCTLKLMNPHSNNRLEKVLVLTSDSRTLLGILISCDQMTNLVLSDTVERIIRPPEDTEPSSEVTHGLYLVRGDNVVCVGLIDQELDSSICWSEVRGAIIEGIRHS